MSTPSRLAGLGLAVFLAASIGSFVAGIFIPHGSGSAVEVTIPKKSSTLEIARILARERVIRDPLTFVLLVWWQGASGRLGVGRYRFSPPAMGTPGVVGALRDGRDRTDTVVLVVKEGTTNRALFEMLAARGFLDTRKFDRASEFSDMFPFLTSLGADATLEGYLFPDTYVFAEGFPGHEILSRMLETFDRKVLESTDPALARAARDASELRRVLTLASLLEREIPHREDRYLVAGVLAKRLEVGIPLQVDATICYLKSLRTPAEPCLPITEADLRAAHPYNTYARVGLPPGPIANPGLGAILAAANPSRSTEYWYYLSDPKTKQTVFSRTLEEHREAKRRYLSPF